METELAQSGADASPRGIRLSRRTMLAGLPVIAMGLGLAACSKVVGTVLPEGEIAGLPDLAGTDGRPVPGFASDEFRRGPAILNIWASWCPDCRAEHDQLMRLSRSQRVRLLGLVFRDKPEAAAAYLRRAGNPYAAVAMDDGRIPGLLGQKGVPYSYVLSHTGRVIAMVRGQMDDKAVKDIVMPALRVARAESRPIA